MGNAFGDNQHLPGFQFDVAKLRLPDDRALETKDQFMEITAPVLEVHRLFRPLGQIDAQRIGFQQGHGGAAGLIEILGD